MADVSSEKDAVECRSEESELSCFDENCNVGTNTSKCVWKDITDSFKSVCKDLQLGELIHDANFSLVEGMSAIEMMDPKMDAGMSCNLAKHKVLSFQQAIKDNAIKINNFPPDELIGIIDDSISCLVTWLEGHSLVQTVFINLYLHDPNLIEDSTLRSFGTCFLKIVDVVRNEINWAGVYEEEDFQSMIYNFKLSHDITETAAMTMVKEAEEEFSKAAKNTRVRAGVDRDEFETLKHNLSLAMSSRLKFFRLFYATMLAFGKERGAGIADAEKHLKQLSEQLLHIKSTIELGSYKSTEVQQEQQQCGDRTFSEGFDPMVNQRLLPPTFPRFVTIKSRSESIDYIQQLVSRLQHIISVISLNNFHEIFDFCLEFSKASSCLLSRSILQLIILPINKKVFGRELVTDFIKETIKSFCCSPPFVPKCPLYNNAQVKEFVDAFLVHCARPIISMIQITGHNRARQRDKWARQLEELGALQDEAEKIDSFIHAMMLKTDPSWKLCLNFGTWVLYLVLKVMTLYVISGLELELYSTYEYNYIFWYLSEGMYNWVISTIKRAETFHQDNDSFSIMPAKGAKKNKKKKKSRFQNNELVTAQALHSLTGGYYKAVIGLGMDGKLCLPKFDFDCEEVRYNHRFTPFAYIATPPAFHYKQFKEHTDTSHCRPPIQPADLYNSACKCFELAKRELESITNPNEEVQALVKVAKTNLIVMRILQGGHKKDSKVPPEFNFDAHCHFPVIKLV